MKLNEWFTTQVNSWDHKVPEIDVTKPGQMWNDGWYRGQLNILTDLYDKFDLGDKLDEEVNHRWLDIRWDWLKEGREPGSEEDDRVLTEENQYDDSICQKCADPLQQGAVYPVDSEGYMYCSYHCRKLAIAE